MGCRSREETGLCGWWKSGREDTRIRGYEDMRILVRMFSAGDFGDIQRLFRNRPEYVRARSGRCGVRVPGTNAWLYLYKQGGFWCGAVAVGQTKEGFGQDMK